MKLPISISRRSRIRSLSTPIMLGAVSVPLSVTLLVGWTLLISRRLSQNPGNIAVDIWLLVLGIISFVVIATVLVLLSYYLGREIIEVRRQDTFIDSVTHELKTPIASLRLCLETAQRADLPAGELEKLHAMMLKDARRLGAFVDDILQATRLAEDGELGTNLDDVDINSLFLSIQEELSQSHGQEAQAIESSLEPELWLTTDCAMLRVVLRNVLDNALKYSNGKTVRFEAKRERSVVRFVVQDDGIGIDKSAQKRVFTRFYRVDHPDVRKRKGTGLGLFVVASLVKHLGGVLELTSAGEDKGTRVSVVIPNQEGAST